MSELMDCPFCGEAVQIGEHPTAAGLRGFSCGGCVDGFYCCFEVERQQQAIAAWNRRAPVPAGEAAKPLPISVQAAIDWLAECARYFEKKPTNGEDKAYWAKVANAENARKIAELVAALSSPPSVDPRPRITVTTRPRPPIQYESEYADEPDPLTERALLVDAREALFSAWMKIDAKERATAPENFPETNRTPYERALNDACEEVLAIIKPALSKLRQATGER